jgi:hypothetical protein
MRFADVPIVAVKNPAIATSSSLPKWNICEEESSSIGIHQGYSVSFGCVEIGTV